MEVWRVGLKVIMWVLIIYFVCNFIMEKISYSFYKKADKVEEVALSPVKLDFNQPLTGYGCNLEADSGQLIFYFGGSNDIAYNSIAKYGQHFDCPMISVDYYGTQDSEGKMNLSTMQKSTTDAYDWIAENYPGKEIIVIGHSYGSGMAAYVASQKQCASLVLMAGYRDVSDLYNKILPIFWGPAKVFISNNMRVDQYAKNVTCPTYVLGSTADKTLDAALQAKVAACFENAQLKIFEGVKHEDFFTEEVVAYFQGAVI
ncbi:alpha/beta fold hydrolase [Enterococcus sp. 669A]|uniref:Alpha/beta fold hydrolase n=1 Tax=Candidatus Enterococcus moelleringii TaxID=2815325 RepID=A0ABS3LB87_9ENTE|nr:alpha/beta fold hydrolase [Enterococcus sp. 669A]MBO1306887.1 alpha/beta fold hydrolase [Enterococcus sp. 669A]